MKASSIKLSDFARRFEVEIISTSKNTYAVKSVMLYSTPIDTIEDLYNELTMHDNPEKGFKVLEEATRIVYGNNHNRDFKQLLPENLPTNLCKENVIEIFDRILQSDNQYWPESV